MSLALGEKNVILPKTITHSARVNSWSRRLLVVLPFVFLWGILHVYNASHDPVLIISRKTFNGADALCPQTDPLVPVKHAELYNELSSLVESENYRHRAIHWMSGAVKIPTESYDGMGPVGEDPRWEAFAPLHTYLLGAFPLIHTSLKVTKVNTYGLVYHWQGSNPALKPLLLTAHQDVVPVDPETVDQWVHPPYSGYFDGTYLWGRGSVDDKSGLIASMSAVETLLESGYVPTRTIVLAYGFDEESSGEHGAQRIGDYLLEHYGENSFAMLVDEGNGWTDVPGQLMATPAVGEKGYLDVRVEVKTPGGHSSIPPPHTSIGILSALIVALESNPFVPRIGRTQPMYGTLKCLAAYSADLPASLRKDIIRSVDSDKALHRVEDYIFARQPLAKAYFGTTQAVDLIQGGVKINALPQKATAVVNHRIASDSSLDVVKRHVTSVLSPLASKFNLSLVSFGNEIISDNEPRYGSLNLSDPWGTAFMPAPVTPTHPGAAPYKLLSGTIKSSLLNSSLFRHTNTSVIVAPGISTGNTDTRFYWRLTPHIFRYSHHGRNDSYGGLHTINEAVQIDGIQRIITFFITLILNSDESTLL